MAGEKEVSGGSVRSIEEGGQRYLAENPAPREIEADWHAWIDRSAVEVWARPGLSPAQRSIATISILSVLREEGPLAVHVEAALANGLSREEIGELIMHSAVYAGVPQALRSMRVARQVFDRIDSEAAGDSIRP
ncbi:MAG: 4-carboxymuconolactone decarboxylase [Deltaproteobacteria bacterium]|nr:4-carboxymuconolactone decarboxylase [Deltaproteobacteria bacterium]